MGQDLLEAHSPGRSRITEVRGVHDAADFPGSSQPGSSGPESAPSVPRSTEPSFHCQVHRRFCISSGRPWGRDPTGSMGEHPQEENGSARRSTIHEGSGSPATRTVRGSSHGPGAMGAREMQGPIILGSDFAHHQQQESDRGNGPRPRLGRQKVSGRDWWPPRWPAVLTSRFADQERRTRGRWRGPSKRTRDTAPQGPARRDCRRGHFPQGPQGKTRPFRPPEKEGRTAPAGFRE